MSQLLFETRERARELMDEAISIWRATYQIEDIEGVEKDPVFILFMMALAHQGSELQSNWERSKSNLLYEFFDHLAPILTSESTPATMIIKSQPHREISEVELNSSNHFKIAGSDYNFIPLLNSRIISHTIRSITRLDRRRWRVSLAFNEAIDDLEGISFQILDRRFKDLKISYGKRTLAIVKPWDRSDLPLAECFSTENLFYEQHLPFEASSLWFDLFAEHNSRLFIFKKSKELLGIDQPFDKIDLIFEFSAIDDEFNFDVESLVLNVFPIVNVQINSVDLTSANPIARIEDGAGSEKEFLGIIPPSYNQAFKNTPITIRRFDADRFNLRDLLNLINEIIFKFSSDFYAFQEIPKVREGGRITQLHSLLKSIKDDIKEQSEVSSGIYLMLKKRESLDESSGVSLRYLTTNGAAIRAMTIDSNSYIAVPSKLNPVNTAVISAPINTSYVVNKDREADRVLAQYRLATGDRLVTLADIKLFCQKELFMRHSIMPSSILNVDVKHRLNMNTTEMGYEIVCFITIKSSALLKKKFVDKISDTELLLQKMIENRSVGIYPVVVSIAMEE